MQCQQFEVIFCGNMKKCWSFRVAPLFRSLHFPGADGAPDVDDYLGLDDCCAPTNAPQ